MPGWRVPSHSRKVFSDESLNFRLGQIVYAEVEVHAVRRLRGLTPELSRTAKRFQLE